jgi:FeS assembly protein IscX
MSLKWTDITEITMQLVEKFPNIDPQYISFPELHRWICELEDFDDDPRRGGEKILEAIQMTWLEEVR